MSTASMDSGRSWSCWKSDRVKNKKAGNSIDDVVTEELEVPSGINKSGRKVGSIFTILCS
jgi:hypothetical protein